MEPSLLEEWKNCLSKKIRQLKSIEEKINNIEIELVDSLDEFIPQILDMSFSL